MPVQDTFQSIAFSTARFAGFTANAVIFGLVPIILLVLRPSFASLHQEQWAQGRRRVSERIEDLLQASLVASCLATVVGIVLQMAIFAGPRGDVSMSSLTELASTPFGRAYLLRLPLLAGLAILLVNRVRAWALAGAGDDRAAPRKGWWGVWLALSLVLLATSSFSGHASVGQPRMLSIGNDVLHLLSGAIWFTGIIVLSTIVPKAWAMFEDERRLELLTPVVVRFSQVAVVTITVVGVTGTINSLFDVGKLRDLVDEGYGIALSTKIVFFLGILALGGINHFYVRRRLERGTAASKLPAFFRKAIAVELAFGLTVMGITGVLTGLNKTRESANPAELVTARML